MSSDSGPAAAPPGGPRLMGAPDDSWARTYGGLHEGAVFFDRSTRSRARFTGPKAAETLAGLVTSDVMSLRPGDGQYAAALTPKGKIIADLRIFARTDDLFVDVAPPAAAGWWAMVRKFVNPRLAKYADVSAETVDVGVFGARAHEIVAAALGIDPATLGELRMFAHREAAFGEDRLMVARVPDLGIAGYDIFGPPHIGDALMATLREHGALAGAPALETLLRIEAGRPAWGLDMDDNTLAQEANLEELGAISFTKGCYTGQETVARVHFRGHVNRQLRGLRVDATRLPARAAELVDEEGRTVGDVRSVAVSPRHGGVALAMVRREIPVGARLTARWSEGDVPVVVCALPFASDTAVGAQDTPPTENGRG